MTQWRAIVLVQDGQPTSEYMTLYRALNYDSYRIELLQLADGTTFDMKSLPLELHGTTSNNSLSAAAGHFNEFYGGAGNDTLYGYSGVDHFYFNRGDGADVIQANDTGEALGVSDRIIFGEGISQEDIRLEGYGEHLILNVMSEGEDTSDQITLNYVLNREAYGVEELAFADGSVVALDSLLAAPMQNVGTDSADSLYGGHGVTTNFMAGKGSDYLYGYTGEDRYHFGRGDGYDYVYDYGTAEDGSLDTVVLGEGIGMGDVRLTANSQHAFLTLLQDGEVTTDQLRLTYQVSNEDYHIEQLEFADGTKVNLDSVPFEWYGSTSNNTLYGSTGKVNAFFGGQGNDTLYGSTNSDFYHFSRGDGSDTVSDAGGVDSIVFGEGISEQDLLLEGSGSNLVMKILSDGQETGDQIYMQYGKTNEDYRVENFEFSDGTSVTLVDLLATAPNDPLA